MILEFRIALTVDDFDAARAFYEKTLGLEFIQEWDNPPGRGLILQIKNATLELLDKPQAALVDQIEAGARVSGQIRFALEVPSLDEAVPAMLANGAKTVHEAVITPWGDRNQRLLAPGEMQVTVYEAAEKSSE